MSRLFFEKKLYNFFILAYLIKYYHVLKKSQKNPAYFKKIQEKNIKKFVNYIYTIPFYRQRFDACKLTPKDIVTEKDFQKLPLLTKAEYKEWIQSTVAQNPESYKQYNITSSSGSAGVPLKLYRYPSDVASDIANLYRGILMQNAGYRIFRDKFFSITSHGAPYKENLIQKLGFLRQKQITAAKDPADLIREFNAFSPDFVYGNTSALQFMASYALENQIKIHQPKCISGISERIEHSTRQLIEQAFGVAPFDIYGTSETGNIAIEKPNAPGQRLVWSDTHAINIIDDNGQSKATGEGMICVTPLLHKSFPMVNYVVGDYVEIKTENGFQYITDIIGRTNDIIRNSDGTFCTWMYINKITSELDGVSQYRVIQNDYDTLIIELVSCDQNPETKKKVEEELSVGLNEVFEKHPKHLVFEWKDAILPDANGKVKMFISNIK